MKKALETAIQKFNDRPDFFSSNFSSSTLHSLLTFCLGNSYFEYNGDVYSQQLLVEPWAVELAEIK